MSLKKIVNHKIYVTTALSRVNKCGVATNMTLRKGNILGLQ